MSRKKDMENIAEKIGQPISEKMDRLELEVRRDGEQTRKEYKQQIGAVKEVVDAVLDDLSAREKKELYDLNTLVDIADLEDTEKEFLLSVLCTLADMTDEVTESQQGYIRSVKNYLKIRDVQPKVDLSKIENIDSKKAERAVLQCVMEFLFLENYNHNYWNEYDDVLDYFSVRNSEIRKIEFSIDSIFKAVGAMGLAEKFGYVGEDINNNNNLELISISDLVKDKFEKILNSEESMFGIFFDLSFDDVQYFDDDIHTKLGAEKKARNVFSSIYDEANSFINNYSSNSFSKTVGDEFFERIKHDILEVTDLLKNLNDEIKSKNETLLQEFLSFLELSSLKANIIRVAENELNDNYYKFSNLSHYINKIEVDWSYPLERPFGKDWHYDAFEAYSELENDLTEKCDSYCKCISNLFRKEIIRPIINFANRIKF